MGARPGLRPGVRGAGRLGPHPGAVKCDGGLPMRSPMSRRIWLAIAALAICLEAAGATEVELYKARFRSAAELAELVGPLIEPDGVAVPDDSGGFILLRGSPEAIAQALETLERIDTQPRQFRISSEVVSRSVLQARGLRVGGWVSLGDLRVGRTLAGPEGVRVSAHQLRADSGRRFLASVVALENAPAEIWTGNLFPFTVSEVEVFEPGRRHTQRHGQLRVRETTAFVPVRRGLRVRARGSGNAVDLELVPVMEDGDPQAGIRELGASTRLRIQPGEQVVIGSIDRDDRLSSGDPLQSATLDSFSGDLILVGVEELE